MTEEDSSVGRFLFYYIDVMKPDQQEIRITWPDPLDNGQFPELFCKSIVSRNSCFDVLFGKRKPIRQQGIHDTADNGCRKSVRCKNSVEN